VILVPAVLCDVDGTLVDTTYLHTVCWWQAFAEAGHQVSMAAIRAAVGMGADALVPHLLRREAEPGEAARIGDGHDRLFRPYWERLQPTPGATALVRTCAKRGLTVVLVSSAPMAELTALRRALDADDAITAATVVDEADAGRPAPDLVTRALRLARTDPGDAVFLGDTVWDVRAANRAGVACVAVTCGGTTVDELRVAGAAEVYPDPAALLDDLRGSPLARLL
jgi:HAD superfamily hydrolase (TIGR01509 family)